MPLVVLLVAMLSLLLLSICSLAVRAVHEADRRARPIVVSDPSGTASAAARPPAGSAATAADKAIELAYATVRTSVMSIDSTGVGTKSGTVYFSRGDSVSDDHVDAIRAWIVQQHR